MDRFAQNLVDCIGAAQAAGLGTGTWETLLEQIGSAFPGTKLAIASKQLDPVRSIGLVSHGFDADIVRDYEEHYSRINPWTPHWTNISSLTASASDDVLPSEQFRRHEFYEFIERSGDAESAAGVKLFDDGNSMATLALHYGVRQAEEYNISVPRFLNALAPHLEFAVQLGTRIAALSEPTQTLERAVQQFQTPAFLVDHRGTLLDANSPGRDLLVEGQVARLESGRLWMADGVARSRFDSKSRSDRPKTVRLDAGPATAWRLFEFSSDVLHQPVPWIPVQKHWVMAVYEPAIGKPSILEQAQSFGLTRQETRVAAALVDGLRVEAIADGLGISSATVRQHLKSIFAKTSTHRQAEVIAKLLSPKVEP